MIGSVYDHSRLQRKYYRRRVSEHVNHGSLHECMINIAVDEPKKAYFVDTNTTHFNDSSAVAWHVVVRIVHYNSA